MIFIEGIKNVEVVIIYFWKCKKGWVVYWGFLFENMISIIDY